MLNWIAEVFDTTDFPERWHCGHWTALHGWTHIAADLAIWGAYVTIPAMLAYFVLRRRDIPFQPVFWCFFLFIISCGTTHLMEATIFWWPAYRLAAIIKVITAAASWGTVIALTRVVPQALTLKSPQALEKEIAQRKQAEEALRRSEERFRRAFEHAAVGMAVMTPGGRLLQVNAAFSALTGRSIAELVDHDVRELIELDDYLIFNEQLGELNAGRLPSFQTELRGLKRDGQTFWTNVAVSSAPGEPGQSAICLLQAQDITKRREAQAALEASEERWRHVFMHNPIAVYEIDFLPLSQWIEKGRAAGLGDLKGYLSKAGTELDEIVPQVRVQDANPAAIELFEAENKQQLAESFTKVFNGKSSISAFEPELDALWNRRGRVALERSGKTLRGKQIDCLLHWTPAPQAGDLSRTIVAVTDITERKRLEAKMLQMQKLESLEVLAGGIAHDFNNLLMGMLGNAELALMDLSPEATGREHIAQIRKAALRAAELCKQMLAYSGKGKFIIQTVNLASLVEEMGHLLEVSISKKVILKYAFAEGVLPVEADVTQLRQVVMNLITNASDAIGDKSGVITLAVGMTRVDDAYLTAAFGRDDLPPGYYTYLEVSDTGCGMSEETQKRIFEPFFTTKFTGRGLGLAAVLGIVRGHSGAIKVYSQEGKGTTIKVLLPCSQKAPTELPAIHELPPGWRGEGTVLVVDDDDTARSVAEMILSRHGFSVLSARDGIEAVEAFARHQHEIVLVLLDMTMPRQNGEETFREMRRIRSDLRVLLTSGYNEQDATNRFAGKGLAGFIQKPYGAAQFISRVQQILSTDSTTPPRPSQ